jgi:peroxiredoxin
MAAVNSTMLPLGTQCPDFQLPDTTEKLVSRDDFHESPVLVVAFISNHCPFVKHIRHELAALGREYQERGVAMVAISANDVANYPDDSPGKMAEEVRNIGYTFPYLYDESQAVAQTFRAACTPDFYVFDRERKLAYRGQFDSSRPGNDQPINGSDLRAAVDALLAGNNPPEQQLPSIGCNIKWKAGNEPDYFRS